VLIEGRWDDAASEAGAGSIRLRAWGENAENLIDPFLEALQSLPIGQPPEIKRTKAIGAYATSLSSASATIRLVSAPPVAQSPDIVRQDGSKQADRPAQKTLQDLNFTKDPIMKDFFISYTKADQAWAEWIAWTLEGAGYSTVIQTWDFRPGTNFVLEMQRAATEANRTIAVLSQKYLDSTFTQPEWAAAFAQDPQGKKQKLIPVRIAACELTGILAPIVYLDLVGLPEDDARTALLGAFSIRNKPASAPAFPGVPSTIASPPQPAYPGTTDTTSAPIAEILSTVAEDTDQSRPFSASQRLQFMRQLNEIVPQHFNMLLFAVNPPAGLIPPMPAPQGDRTSALLTWAEAPGGCGLSVLEELLDTIVSPSPFGTGEQPNRNAPAVPISSDISISALGPQRLTVPEKSAAEIIRNLKESTPSYEFHKRAKELYLGRWPQEPGWQATVHDLPRNLSGGLWHCSFREVGSGTLVMASTIQDISALRPGYLVTVSGRISDVSPLESVSLEDAIIRGDHVPS
jgi:hypothetical protein